MSTNFASASASTATMTAPEKVTRRAVYTTIQKYDVPDWVRSWVDAELTKMDAANANRQSKPSKKEQENQPIKDGIFALLRERGSMVASAIGEAMNISTSKASALCRQMVEDGQLSVAEVKSPKKGGGKVKQYTAIEDETEDEDEGEETVEGAIVLNMGDDGDTNGTVQATDHELNSMF